MKPGDIVTLNDLARNQPWYPRWRELYGDGPFKLTALVGLGYTAPDAFSFVLMDGSHPIWDYKRFGEKIGVSIVYLKPNVFLTAAQKAIDLKGETHGTHEGR